jgi:ribosomal protein L29|tara:strand:+ start:377 stop:745 length:369 start_codon:yes stop_codon:yes gene_type:complete
MSTDASYGVSQRNILKGLKDGMSKSEIYDLLDKRKEQLFKDGVKPSVIEDMDKLFDERFENAMDDYSSFLKNRSGMKSYRKKQRSAKGSDTGSDFKSGGRVKLKGGGICKKGMNPNARGKNS